MLAADHLHALILGIDWTDPAYLLDRFGAAFLWISLVMVFVECGLFFPFLPGDTLLLSLGIFIATPSHGIDNFPGPGCSSWSSRSCCSRWRRCSATWSATR